MSGADGEEADLQCVACGRVTTRARQRREEMLLKPWVVVRVGDRDD